MTTYNESEIVDAFLKRAQELQERPFIQTWTGPKMSIKWDHEEGLTTSTGEYDEEQFRSFLLTIRLFLMQDEPTYISRVFNVAELRLTDDDLRRKLREARQHWLKAQKQGFVTFKLPDGTVPPDRIVSLWINGHYFHNAADAKQLESVLPDVNQTLSRFTFEDYLLTATRVVFFMANVLRRARAESLLPLEA